jgi:hypothetical protein
MKQNKSRDDFGSSYYSDGTSSWLDSALWDAPGPEGMLTITQLPEEVLKVVNGLLEDKDRIEKAGLNYPIVLTPEGNLADGYHRVAKAILEGKTRVPAKFLRKMPLPYRRAGLWRRFLNLIHDLTERTD